MNSECSSSTAIFATLFDLSAEFSLLLLVCPLSDDSLLSDGRLSLCRLSLSCLEEVRSECLLSSLLLPLDLEPVLSFLVSLAALLVLFSLCECFCVAGTVCLFSVS